MACDMEALDAVAARHDLVVIEDAAHAVNASYRGPRAGNVGIARSTLVPRDERSGVRRGRRAPRARRRDADARRGDLARERHRSHGVFCAASATSTRGSPPAAATSCRIFWPPSPSSSSRKLPAITRGKDGARRAAARRPRSVSGTGATADRARRQAGPIGICLRSSSTRRGAIGSSRRCAPKASAPRSITVPLHSAPYAKESPAIDMVDLPVTDRVAASLVRLPLSAAFTSRDCEDVLTACIKVIERMAAAA